MAEETGKTEGEIKASETTETPAEVTETPSEAKEAAKQNQTLEDMVAEETAKRDAEDKEKAEAKSEEPEGEKADKDKEKGKKLTANERVRQAVEQKNEAIARAEAAEKAQTELKDSIDSFKTELAEIKAKFEKGDISKSEAREQTETAEDAIKKIVESIKFDEDMEPYKEQIVNLVKQLSDAVVTAKMAPIEKREAERQATEARKREESIQKEVQNGFKDVSKGFPELFDGEDEDGFPKLKPEFEEKMLKLAADFNVPYTDEKGEKQVYNSVLTTKSGQRMLLQTIYRDIEIAKKAKKETDTANAAVEAAKKGRVETPESRKGTSAKKQTLEEIVKEEIAAHK